MTPLKKFQRELCLCDIDAALISSEINERYISGFSFSDGYILITRNDAFLFTDSRYIEAAKASVKELHVILAGSMTESLKSILKDKKIKKLAVEESSMTLSDFDRFKTAFDNCTLTFGASDILKKLRSVKSEEEIKKIEEAQRITDLAFLHILDYISPNATEKDIALELEFFMRKSGAEGIAFDTIAVSGSASSLPHGVPRDIPLEKGFLTMDLGAMYDGYCSDMTRTVVIGKADEEMKTVYNTVLLAQETALNNIRVGKSCRDADDIARSIIRDAGFGANFGHSLGHGVGMFIHEFPSLSPKADPGSVLTQGNVVTVEPGIYIEGKYGCRIEDMIAICPDGSVRNFTKSTKELIELC